MDTKYHAGDVVYVRSDLRANSKRYPMDGCKNGFVANEDMVLFRGKPVTIFGRINRTFSDDGYGDYYYTIGEDHGKWHWTDAMFEDYSRCEELADPESLDILYSQFSVK